MLEAYGESRSVKGISTYVVTVVAITATILAVVAVVTVVAIVAITRWAVVVVYARVILVSGWIMGDDDRVWQE